MELEPVATRVLLGNLEPILRVGLAAVLTEVGADVVAQERSGPRIVEEAERLTPDVVVLDLDDGTSRRLCSRVRAVSPRSKVILWAKDETVMEVLDPESETSRVVTTTCVDDLHRELTISRNRSGNRVEE